MGQRMQVRLPTSTSNIGPGFDTLGIALTLHNYVEGEIAGDEIVVESAGRDAEQFAEAIRGMAIKTVEALAAGRDSIPPGLRLRLNNATPIARGLGSSACLRVGVAFVLNRLCGLGLSDSDVIAVATKLEGHPDNCGATFYGGFTVSALIGDGVVCRSHPVDERLKFVALIPRQGMHTEEARAILPKELAVKDAVFNMNRTALIVSAFADRDYEALRGLFDDRMHQPHRQKILKPLFEVIANAREAGALDAFLSGAGSGIIALTLQNAEQVGAAMQEPLAREGVESELLILTADNRGLMVV